MSPRKIPGDEEASRQPSDGFTYREISEFLLRACHDLRTPLRAMRAHAELLLKDAQAPATADVTQRLEFIAVGAQQTGLLLEGLTNYAIALQLDAESFLSMPVDIALRMVLAKMQDELREHDAQVTYGELPCVHGHPDRLMQVFENLLRNALRHRAAASPRINITAEPHSGQSNGGAVWLFAVRDNGPGVPAAYLESIFKPFSKVGTQRSGAGLGLATCRIIVQKHGGKIWAESEDGGGCTVLMTLPAADDR
jgi:signal transduction histidine kinase